MWLVLVAFTGNFLLPSLGVRSQSSVAVKAAVAPVYPREAVGAVSGVVLVVVEIDAVGKVVEVVSVSGPPIIDHAAIVAARRWSFDAGASDRTVTLKFVFTILPSKTPETDMGAVFHPPYTAEIIARAPKEAGTY